jgi:circadian clock protein KaiC
MSQHEADATEGGDAGDIARVPSLVPGLDAVLCGGFLRGGLYMVQGPAGAGKTILSNQIIYSRAAAEGDRALFITVLGESHGRMLAHLRALRFFDPALLPERVTYISGYQALEDNGLKGLAVLILREVRARGIALLVLDGMGAVEAKAGAGFEMNRFTHELQTLASATNCTMLLLTAASVATAAPEHTMVDGLIELRQRLYGVRNERRLLVHKSRGSAFLEGEHAYHITSAGVAVFPRIEALLATPTHREPSPGMRVPFGIPSFDAMLGGGIPAATMTALVGPSGAGKTTLGLQFLAASSAAEPGLLFGCYESPERLRHKAATLGLDLAGAEQRRDVEILWHPVGEYILDGLAHQLLDAVRRRGVRRLVIDGISGFQQAAVEPERIVRFWSALSNELRALGVTALHTLEMPELAGADIRIPVSGISSLAEVMVLMRYVELRSRLYRLISLLKAREGAFDPTIREFAIPGAGLTVGEPFQGVEAVLSGMAREAARHAATAAEGSERSSPPRGNDTARSEWRGNGADRGGRVHHRGPAGDGAHRRGLPRAACRQRTSRAGASGRGTAPGPCHLRLYDADPRRRRLAAGDAGNRGATRHPLHRHELDARGERARAHRRLRRLRAQAVPARRHGPAGRAHSQRLPAGELTLPCLTLGSSRLRAGSRFFRVSAIGNRRHSPSVKQRIAHAKRGEERNE